MNMVMRFGTQNVCTLLQADYMNSIVEEVERYKMDVVALQEIRLGSWNSLYIIPEMKMDRAKEE